MGNTVCVFCFSEQIKPEHIVGDDSADNDEETQRGEKELVTLFYFRSQRHAQFSSGLINKAWSGVCKSFGPVYRTAV